MPRNQTKPNLALTGFEEIFCCFPRKKAETTAKICEINEGKR